MASTKHYYHFWKFDVIAHKWIEVNNYARTKKEAIECIKRQPFFKYNQQRSSK